MSDASNGKPSSSSAGDEQSYSSVVDGTAVQGVVVDGSGVDRDEVEGSSSTDSDSRDAGGDDDSGQDQINGKRKEPSSSAEPDNNKKKASKRRNRGYTLEDKRNLVWKFLTDDGVPVIDEGVVKGRQFDENGIAAFLHKEKVPVVQHSMLTKWIGQFKLGCYEDFPGYTNKRRYNCNKERVLK